jgi:hypothetical protein
MVKIKYLIGIFSTLVIILLWHSCASASVQHAFELPFSGNTYGGGQHQESFSLDPKSNNVFGSVFMESYGNLSGASLTTNNGIQIAGKASSFTAGSDPKTYINFDIYSVDKKATAITITINYSGGGMYKGEARVLRDDIMSTSDYRSLLNEFINNLTQDNSDDILNGTLAATGTGVDGDLIVHAGEILCLDTWYENKYGSGSYDPDNGRVPNFRNVTVSGTLTTARTYSQNNSFGGRLVFKASGQVRVFGDINMTAKGYTSQGPLAGGDVTTYLEYAGGGGGGGNVNSGGVGDPGRLSGAIIDGGSSGRGVGIDDAHKFGSNGGESVCSGVCSVSGGAGGGYIKIDANEIIIGSNGRILANGENGKSYATAYENRWYWTGGSGGGAGGTIELNARILTLGDNKVLVNGGIGGNGYSTGGYSYSGNGGNGSVGLIKLNYKELSGEVSSPNRKAQVNTFDIPEVAFTINNDAANTDSNIVDLHFNTTSNIQTLKISNYENFYPFQEVSCPADKVVRGWKLIPGDGVRTVYVIATDANNNTSKLLLSSINVTSPNSGSPQPEDTTPPEISICTADGRSATRSGNQVPIIIKAKDNVTPLEDLEVSIDKGATWQAYEPFFNIKVSGSGMKTIYVLVRDQAGNESLDYVQLFVL